MTLIKNVETSSFIQKDDTFKQVDVTFGTGFIS